MAGRCACPSASACACPLGPGADGESDIERRLVGLARSAGPLRAALARLAALLVDASGVFRAERRTTEHAESRRKGIADAKSGTGADSEHEKAKNAAAPALPAPVDFSTVDQINPDGWFGAMKCMAEAAGKYLVNVCHRG